MLHEFVLQVAELDTHMVAVFQRYDMDASGIISGESPQNCMGSNMMCTDDEDFLVTPSLTTACLQIQKTSGTWPQISLSSLSYPSPLSMLTRR